MKVSSSGLSRSLVIEPVKKNGQQTKNNTTTAKATANRSTSQTKETNNATKNNIINVARTVHKKPKNKQIDEDEEAAAKCEYQAK